MYDMYVHVREVLYSYIYICTVVELEGSIGHTPQFLVFKLRFPRGKSSRNVL